MAERAAVLAVEKDAILVTWTGLLNGDTGQPIDLPAHQDRTYQVTGTFGAGGSVTLQGSNVGVTYATLTDTANAAITSTSADMAVVTEAPKYIRPSVTAGDGTTSLTATLYCRRGTR